MKTIWKFWIGYGDDLKLPRGATILHVGLQNGGIYLWALVDPERETEIRCFRVCGTGHPIDDLQKSMQHIGTVFQDQCVWHIFEERAVTPVGGG